MISDPAALTAEINDPSTSAQRLVEIAGSFPEFGPIVAEHPNASLDVLSYLLKHGDDSTRKAAARRRARDVAKITARQLAPEVEAQPAQPEKPAQPEATAREEVTLNNDQAREESIQAEVPSVESDQNATMPVQSLREVPPAAFRAAPVLEDEVDATQISQRSRVQTWRIRVDGEGEVTFSATEILIGRKPAARREHPSAELVTVPDPTKTVSKTHARMVLRGDQWMIIDLESTNGVFVETSRGEHQVVAGSEIAVNEGFSLGDLRLTISGD